MTHGQFAFTTTEAGNYLACFWVDENYKGSKGVTVSLDWRTGIAAKDWESVARKEKIEVNTSLSLSPSALSKGTYLSLTSFFGFLLTDHAYVTCACRVLNLS